MKQNIPFKLRNILYSAFNLSCDLLTDCVCIINCICNRMQHICVTVTAKHNYIMTCQYTFVINMHVLNYT